MNKTIKLLATATLILSTVSIESCKKEGCMDDTAINFDDKAKVDDGSCEYESNEGPNSNLPETYVVFEGDTFYQSATAIPPDNNAYRYQVNLSSRKQLDETSNDGNIATTLSLTLTFKDKPTESATVEFSKSRLPADGSDSLNFYVSFFFNTGHEFQGENFISPAAGSMAYTIDGSKFSASIPELQMILESDQSKTATLNGGSLKLDW
ncbi:MAG: hypothetical protein R2813_12710 [Flavobacteriales bacterium]